MESVTERDKSAAVDVLDRWKNEWSLEGAESEWHKHVDDSLRDHIARAVSEARLVEWQPIETAPEDRSVLVYIPNAEHYGEGIYRAILSSEFGSWTTFGLHVGRAVGASWWPTYWTELPDPPEVK